MWTIHRAFGWSVGLYAGMSPAMMCARTYSGVFDTYLPAWRNPSHGIGTSNLSSECPLRRGRSHAREKG